MKFRTLEKNDPTTLRLSSKISSAFRFFCHFIYSDFITSHLSFSDTNKDFAPEAAILVTWDGVENFEKTAVNAYQVHNLF